MGGVEGLEEAHPVAAGADEAGTDATRTEAVDEHVAEIRGVEPVDDERLGSGAGVLHQATIDSHRDARSRIRNRVASPLAHQIVYNHWHSPASARHNIDVVRAARFVGEVASTDPKDSVITVVGGHSGATIVPLLSQSAYGKAVTGDAYAKIVHRIQFGGDEVVQAKDGAGSATLSMAYAGAKFAHALLRGLSGEKGVVTPTFVQSPLFADQGIDFFSSNVELGVRSRLSSSARRVIPC